MAILADFALTWLPAPTLPLSPKLASGSNALARFLQNCPDNAFQMATGARPAHPPARPPSRPPASRAAPLALPQGCAIPARFPRLAPSPTPPTQSTRAATRKFTVVQRFAAILRNGAKLFAVGTGASFIGTGITNGIIAVRQKLEPATPKQTEDMNLARSCGR